MHSRVNFYHTSEIGEEECVVIKKEQVNLAQLTLVFKVMINIMYITRIFKIIKSTKSKLSRDFVPEFKLA